MSSFVQCGMNPSMESSPQARPRRLSLVLFLCAALGAVGTTVSFVGVTSWSQPLPDEVAGLDLPLPPVPEGEEAAWQRLKESYEQIPARRLEVLRERRALLNALAAVNLVASIALFFGALATRRRGATGLRSLHTGLTLSQAYAVLAAIVQGWIQKEVLDAHRTLFQPFLDEAGTVAGFAATAVMSQAVALALGVAVMVAQFLFYVWAQRYFRRQEIAQALGTGISPPRAPGT